MNNHLLDLLCALSSSVGGFVYKNMLDFIKTCSIVASTLWSRYFELWILTIGPKRAHACLPSFFKCEMYFVLRQDLYMCVGMCVYMTADCMLACFTAVQEVVSCGAVREKINVSDVS